MKNKKIHLAQQKTISKKKGFSLIETLVAILIFTLAIGMIASTFEGFLKTYLTEKRQKNMTENAQFALNLMEKTIRTSVVSTSSGSINLDFAGADLKKIKLFDNSQNKCVIYRYNNTAPNKKIDMATFISSTDGISGCDFNGATTFTDLTDNIIENVSVEGRVTKDGNPGIINVAFAVKDPLQSTPINIGMSVSLRGFESPQAVCTGVPTNASVCQGDNAGLTADLAASLVSSCGASKCEYVCNAGYVKSGSSCVVTALMTWHLTGSNYNGSIVCRDSDPALSGLCSTLNDIQTVDGCYWDGGQGGECPLWACDRDATYKCY